MTNDKPAYNQRVDYKGRVYIPKELRTAADMDFGDIVKLSVNKGALCVRRVHVIEIGDKSPEAVEAFVNAAIREMPEETQIAIAARLLELIEQKKGKNHG
jgi:AbrB family transcriptional regulator (stage V sporulation protein T)